MLLEVLLREALFKSHAYLCLMSIPNQFPFAECQNCTQISRYRKVPCPHCMRKLEVYFEDCPQSMQMSFKDTLYRKSVLNVSAVHIYYIYIYIYSVGQNKLNKNRVLTFYRILNNSFCFYLKLLLN